MEVELVDDIWLKIFLTFGVQRASLCQVSKKWRKIILSPYNWKTLENYVNIRTPGFGAENFSPQKSSSLLSFVTRHLTSLVDVNIRIDSDMSVNNFLDTFLQMKSLKRLKLAYCHREPNNQDVVYSSNVVPRCSDLVLLNLEGSDFEISDEGLANIVTGVPNLEELYLGQSYARHEDLKQIYPLKKLQRITVYNAVPIDGLVANMPQLKYIIKEEPRRGFFGAMQSDEIEFRKIGSTFIVSSNFLSSKDVNIVRQVKDLVTYEHSALLVRLVDGMPQNREYFTFLVKELGLDVNYVEPQVLGYRPTIPFRVPTNPLTVLLQRVEKSFNINEEENHATEAWCLDVAKFLLDIGADPNKIRSFDHSPLAMVPRQNIALLLMERGFDIHAFDIEGKPHYFSLLSAHMPEVPRALADVIKKVDINKEFGGHTLLEHAITNRKKYAIDMLNQAGAKWTATALERLIVSIPTEFDSLTLQRRYDMKLLTTAAVFMAIKRGLLSEVKEHLMELPEQLDSRGWTPMHHAALLHDCRDIPLPGFGQSPGTPNERFTRWTKEKAEFSFGSSTQEVDVTRIIGSTSGGNAPDPTIEIGGFGAGFGFGNNNNNNTFGGGGGFAFGGNNEGNAFGGNHGDGGFAFGNNNNNNGNAFGGGGFNYGNNNSDGANGPPQEEEEHEPEVPLKCNIEDVLPALAHCNINARSSYGETPLLLATKSKSLKDEEKEKNIKALLQNGADPNIADNNGWTPLHAALYTGKWNLVKEFISHGASINVQDSIGITPLMALLIGYVHNQAEPFTNIEEEWVKLMTLDVDVSLVDRPFNRSLMHYAACVASPGMMQLICLNKSSTVNARDNEGFAPLHYAVMFGNINAIKFLLENGADPNVQSISLKLTPLMLYVAMRNKASSFSFNMSSTYLMHCLTTQHLLLLSRSLETRLSTETFLVGSFIEPPWTKSPLEKWNERFNNSTWNKPGVEVIELLAPVSDPHVKDAEDSSLLLHLLQFVTEQKNGDYPVLRLIANNKEFVPYWSVPNKYNIIPSKQLFEHMRSGWDSINEKLVKLVLPMCKEHQIKLFLGTDFSVVNTILNYPDEIRAEFLSLIDLATLPTQLTTSSTTQTETLLHGLIGTSYKYSVMYTFFKLSAIKEVLNLQPQTINVQNGFGQTPLFGIVRALVQLDTDAEKIIYVLDVMDLLLEQKDVDVDKADENGDTPLHLAAQRFHLGAIDAMNGSLSHTFIFTVQFCLTAFKLLQSGARVDIKNNQGLTPLDYCSQLVEYFKEFNNVVNQHFKAASSVHKMVLLKILSYVPRTGLIPLAIVDKRMVSLAEYYKKSSMPKKIRLVADNLRVLLVAPYSNYDELNIPVKPQVMKLVPRVHMVALALSTNVSAEHTASLESFQDVREKWYLGKTIHFDGIKQVDKQPRITLITAWGHRFFRKLLWMKAYSSDLCVLVVDPDDVDEDLRTIFIGTSTLIGMGSVIIAVNMSKHVENPNPRKVYYEARLKVIKKLKGVGVPVIEIVPVDVVKGTNIIEKEDAKFDWFDGLSLMTMIHNDQQRTNFNEAKYRQLAEQPFLFQPYSRAVSNFQVEGRIVRGTISVGDKICNGLITSAKEVQSITRAGIAINKAGPGDCVALRLSIPMRELRINWNGQWLKEQDKNMTMTRTHSFRIQLAVATADLLSIKQTYIVFYGPFRVHCKLYSMWSNEYQPSYARRKCIVPRTKVRMPTIHPKDIINHRWALKLERRASDREWYEKASEKEFAEFLQRCEEYKKNFKRPPLPKLPKLLKAVLVPVESIQIEEYKPGSSFEKETGVVLITAGHKVVGLGRVDRVVNIAPKETKNWKSCLQHFECPEEVISNAPQYLNY